MLPDASQPDWSAFRKVDNPDALFCLPVFLQPDNLRKDTDGSGFLYDWTPGRLPAPRELLIVWLTASKYLWKELDRRPSWGRARIRAYREYLISLDPRAKTLDFKGLTPVQNIHGDLTAENVVVRCQGRPATTSADLCFIDPGRPRGMVFMENDEAKMLQSIVTHWELLRGRVAEPYELFPEMTWRKVHLEMLISHWIRLKPHWPQLRKVVNNVTDALFVEHASCDGPGWSPDRLRDRCLRIVSGATANDDHADVP